MPFHLPPLPYALDALEPYIDRKTMEIHHDKHHGGYVSKLNAALEPHPELHKKTLEELLRGVKRLPEEIRAAVRDNGGGHANHSMFWQIMGPHAGGRPEGTIGAEIDRAFGSFDRFKERFTNAALGHFGSGWVFVVDRGDELGIETTANQDSPLLDGTAPIFGLDVWEHAYYLKYQNRRADYIEAWWHVVNWPMVSRRLVREAVESVR